MGKHVKLETPNRWIPDPQLRHYLFRVATACMGVLVGQGIFEAATGELWLGLVSAVLGVAGGAATELAAANTPREPN